MLIKYSGKYVNIYFIMKITFHNFWIILFTLSRQSIIVI